ncbi:MAG: right-handed parallel beta-helix repeat-containing protein [Nocardioidaceae bacterium]|nr:right-handed parallel beta-helix repeat-containing protein [Nocardioidaceae bacterium]
MKLKAILQSLTAISVLAATIAVNPATSLAATSQTIVVDNGNPAASDSAAGTATTPLKTIGQAAQRAERNNVAGTATTVLIHPGTYRESVDLYYSTKATAAPLTFEAAPGGPVVMSGSDVWTDWRPTGDGEILAHEWAYDWGLSTMPASWNDWWSRQTISDVVLRRELVYVDGERMRQVLSLEELRQRTGAYFVSESANKLYLRLPAGADAATATVEVGVRPRLFNAQKWRNLTVRGITFQHAVTPMNGSSARFLRVSNVLLEDAVFQENSWGGLAFQYSKDLELRNTRMNSNGVKGVNIFKSGNILLDGTQISYNNWRGHWGGFHGWDAGSKIWGARGATVRNHQSVGNLSHGLWFDTDNVGVVIENSLLANNLKDGVFLEASQGPFTLRGNTICGNRQDGITDGKADNVTVENNTIFDNTGGQIQFTGRKGGRPIIDQDTGQEILTRSRNWTLRGNTIVGNQLNQDVIATTMGDEDWNVMRGSLTADGNSYYNPVKPRSFEIPGGKYVDLPGWRQNTGADATSTFAAPGAPLECDAPTDSPPVEPPVEPPVDPPVVQPAPVTDLTASPGDRSVSLAWTNPSDIAGVTVVATTGQTAPSSPSAGTVVYDGTGSQSTHTGLNNGTTYSYSVFTYDTERNYSDAVTAAATPVAPKVQTRLEASASASLITAGDGVEITGRLFNSTTGAPMANESMTMVSQPVSNDSDPGGHTSAAASTDANGRATFSLTPSENVRVTLEHSSSSSVTSTANVTVLVRPDVDTLVEDDSIRLGRAVVLTGQVTPAHAGQKAMLHYDGSGTWEKIQSTTLADDGSFRFGTGPSFSGLHGYRVFVPADADHAEGMSQRINVRVYAAAITAVRYDPAGDDLRNLNGEQVTVRNVGGVAINLAGWRLRDRYLLPAYQLAPDARVVIHSGSGKSGSGHVYLGSTREVWPNKPGTVARLYDDDNALVSSFTY